VCDQCGTVECLEQVPVPDELLKPKSLGRRYDVTRAELVVHGTCPKCHD
jgi:Fe2+ or Zn2+ uptake regulation protein